MKNAAVRLSPVLTLGPFLFLASLAHTGKLYNVDVSLARALQSLVPEPALVPFMLVNLLGQRVAVLVYGTITVLGLRRLHHTKESLLVLAALLLALTNSIVKILVGRPRPDADLLQVRIEAPGSLGFPSGDAQFFTIFFGLLFVLAPQLTESARTARLLRVACGLLLVLVGPARVALGVHWPSDVLGGYLLGGFLLWCLLATHRRFFNTDVKVPIS